MLKNLEKPGYHLRQVSALGEIEIGRYSAEIYLP
jgi:hypothetical protein